MGKQAKNRTRDPTALAERDSEWTTRRKRIGVTRSVWRRLPRRGGWRHIRITQRRQHHTSHWKNNLSNRGRRHQSGCSGLIAKTITEPSPAGLERREYSRHVIIKRLKKVNRKMRKQDPVRGHAK